MQFTTGDGCPIGYKWDGASDAPVLILSNSLGTSMDLWEPQLGALAAKFRVLRYDTRGHGTSGVPLGSYSMDRLGRDVIEMMDALGLCRISFCGLSMGGMTGQWLGVRAPERIDRLILANTSAYMGPPSAWDERIGKVSQDGMGALTDAVLERWFTTRFLASSDQRIERVRSMLLSTDRRGYAGCCAAIRDMDMRPVLGMISAPTLVIGGRYDPATPPSQAEALASGIADARLVMMDAAHLSNVEDVETFNSAVLGHLAA